MTTYATVVQLAADPWGLTPLDAARLLVRASEVIDQALRTAIYAVDTTGAPTDAAVIQVLADATCAQVEFWETGDEEDDILGPIDSFSLSGLSMMFNDRRGDRESPTYLAPRAHRILVNAGLRDGQPVSW
jgi:hypothetical protein